MRSLPDVRHAVKLRRVHGWLSDAEAGALYELAAQAAGPVLEIGTWCGLSACYLAAGCEQGVWTVDPHDPALWNPTQRQVLGELDTLAVASEHWAALGLAERITPVKATSKAAARRVPEAFGLVFIDGDHKPAAVRADIQRWAPRVLPGGALALHDWGQRGDEAEPWDVAGCAAAYLERHPEWRFEFRVASLGVLRRAEEAA